MIKFFTAGQSKKYISKASLSEFNFNPKGRGVYLKLSPSQELYSHNQEVILKAWKEITFPNKEKFQVNLYNLPYNYSDQTNAVTFTRDYDSNIVLLGRSVPIPHEMTEYLVAHEFGHSVQGILAPQQVYKNEEKEKLWKQYMKLRGFTKRGGGDWHKRPGEIFANDFRVFYSPFWEEWWPHDVVRPEKVKGLKSYFKTLSQLAGDLK